MPSGNNEIQLVIKVFTAEDPTIRIREMAKAFIETQKWTSPEVIYEDQKEEVNERDDAQWYSLVFALGLDHIDESGGEWFSDVEKLSAFAKPLADLSGPDSVVTLCFRSALYMSETIEIFSESTKSWDMAGMIKNLVLTYKEKNNDKLLEPQTTRKTIELCVLAAIDTAIVVGYIKFMIPWLIMGGNLTGFAICGIISFIIFLPTLRILFLHKNARGAILATSCVIGLLTWILFYPVANLFAAQQSENNQKAYELQLKEFGNRMSHFKRGGIAFHYPAILTNPPMALLDPDSPNDMLGVISFVPAQLGMITYGLPHLGFKFHRKSQVEKFISRYTDDGDNGGVFVKILKSGEIALSDGKLSGKGFIIHRDFQMPDAKNLFVAQIEYEFPSCFVVMNFQYPSTTQEEFMELQNRIMESFRITELKKTK